jgi:hypothetical protein
VCVVFLRALTHSLSLEQSKNAPLSLFTFDSFFVLIIVFIIAATPHAFQEDFARACRGWQHRECREESKRGVDGCRDFMSMSVSSQRASLDLGMLSRRWSR